MFDALRSLFHRRFGKDRAYYQIVNDLFGICPNNIELYKLALIHRSASLFLDDGTPINNERLEFLGDAVIETVVSDFLFIEFPERSEGYLSQMRSRLVSRSSLNHLALSLGIERYIIAHGSTVTILAQKHLFGDALEAMMGAIYLDQGYEPANRVFINGILRRYVDLDQLSEQESDFKSRLIEWGQKNKRPLQLDTEPCTTHTSRRPRFSTAVVLDGETIGKGEGGSKKESEQAACHKAVVLLKERGEVVAESEYESE